MVENKYHKLLIILLLLVSLLSPSHSFSIEKINRFFLKGDGILHIKNIKSGKSTKVELFDKEGRLQKASLEKINEVFDFPQNDEGQHISLRLILLLDYFSDLIAPNKTIYLKSGYRSHDYNNMLREKGANAAKTSTHIDGLAVDFYIDSIDGKKIWETIRKHNCCGAGYYGGNTVHLDAGRPRFWEAHTSKVKTNESDYNRKIYVSSEYDRYIEGESIKLAFSSVSDFGFGIKKEIQILNSQNTYKILIETSETSDCLFIKDRKSSKFTFTIPQKIDKGRYTIKVDFCNKPFDEMPDYVYSNEIEIF
ncbi:MAG: DUF882 domain-containing protein [Thermodesulfovibrionales bacterium]|nr:DUF882 domain-containing protein [Thermodesulfovibrionales bacterium]